MSNIVGPHNPYPFLAQGVDTLEVSYYLSTNDSMFDFRRLAILRDTQDKKRDREGWPITIGWRDFLLKPSGSSSGYPFVISDDKFRIQFGEFNKPSFHVRFLSEALWHNPGPLSNSIESLHEEFLMWATSCGLEIIEKERVSRVDFAFDYGISRADFTEDNFVTQFVKNTIIRKRGEVQTIQLGKGDALVRAYSKSEEIEESSHKEWFYDIWGCREAWRFEFQFRKELLREFGVVHISDLQKKGGDLLTYLCGDHTTLRVQNSSKDPKDCPIHPIWLDIQNRAKNFGMEGAVRCFPQSETWEQRLLRNVISIEGYIKNYAALNALINGEWTVEYPDILMRLVDDLLARHHQPRWNPELQRRMKRIRLSHE